jgi:cytochrome c oxidase subunit 3
VPESFNPALVEPYRVPAQQKEAATLGMWAFLGTEIMLFGGLIFTYVVYRYLYPVGFTEASRHTHWIIGTANTAILLTSSLTMALGVRAAQKGSRTALLIFLGLTILFGLTFLGLKGLEYTLEYQEHLVPGFGFSVHSPHARAIELFFVLYFMLTGLHSVHMLIGVVVVSALAYAAWNRKFTPEYHTPVELVGLYWHFVDIVWVFLYPIIYLVGRAG